MLERITDRVHLAPGGVNIGVIHVDDRRSIMIDSGLNDTAARKVLRELQVQNRVVSSIVTTHGHADHFGGNAFVVKRSGARVFAPRWDEVILRYPLFQPLCLFAGADPPQSLRGGFLLAVPSPVDVIYDAGPIDVDGLIVDAISLSGHSGNQMGILCDGVFFCADVVLPERVIERYRIPYLYSVRDHLVSLETARTAPHQFAVSGHGPLLDNVAPAVDTNAALVMRVAQIILDICSEPRMPEEILATLLERVGADPSDAPAYYLLHPTVFAYLTYLETMNEVEHVIRRGRSLWVRRR